MKVFISQPMAGKSLNTILHERDDLKLWVKRNYGDVEFLDSFMARTDNMTPLECLAESIKIMSKADLVVMAPRWYEARGCCIEYDCADYYGIKTVEVDSRVETYPI